MYLLQSNFTGVTILLSLTVFLNMVAETMPATSDAVPLLGTYFNCIMFMVASSVVSTILILNYHHRNVDTHEMSDCVSRYAIQIYLLRLPVILIFFLGSVGFFKLVAMYPSHESSWNTNRARSIYSSETPTPGRRAPRKVFQKLAGERVGYRRRFSTQPSATILPYTI